MRSSTTSPPSNRTAGSSASTGFSFRALFPGTGVTDTVRTALALSRAKGIAPLLAGLGADRFEPNGGGTDIEPLMKKGVLGIGHETAMEHYFDWHHTNADMLDKVDPVELRKNVAAMAVLACVLADMPEPLVGPPPAPTGGSGTPAAKQ